MAKAISVRTRIDIGLLFVVVVGGFFAIQKAQVIGDWWHSLWYSPPTEIVQLADDAGMNSRGKRYFYRFSPEFVNDRQMQQYCGGTKLGCTEGYSIYILDGNGNAGYERSIVTAAHEMLHVAYSRLSSKQKQDVDTHLATALKRNDAVLIRDILQGYPQKDYFNEAHSYVGSQLPHLSPWLEHYYKRYFTDRSKSVQAYLHSPEGQSSDSSQ